MKGQLKPSRSKFNICKYRHRDIRPTWRFKCESCGFVFVASGRAWSYRLSTASVNDDGTFGGYNCDRCADLEEGCF